MPNKKAAEENTFDEDMAASPKVTKELNTVQSKPTFDRLEQALSEMPQQMRTFSDAMKMRYVENSLGDDQESSRKYQELRKGTKNDALVYLTGILPVSETVVSEIGGLFDFYFKRLKFEELREQFHLMLNEIINCRELCEMAKLMHEDLMLALKQREDDAREVTMQLVGLQQEFESKKTEYEKSAALKRKLAIGFSFVPGLNLIVAPALFIAAKSDRKGAIVQGCHAKSKGDAAIAITETFQPALSAFIEALGCVAGFFSEMETEMMKCHGKGERCFNEKYINEKQLQCIYSMIQIYADNIIEKCQQFRMVLPHVKTDFQRICPDDGKDDTEIDHDYIYRKLTEAMRMSKDLRKPYRKISDNLERQRQRQRQLANTWKNK